MNYRAFTSHGQSIAVPVDCVKFLEQDPNSPTHSILTVDFGNNNPQRVSIDEDFFTALSRLNTVAN